MNINNLNQSYDIVLASGSPRRKEILSNAGFEFRIVKSEGEEVITSSDPSRVVEELSLQKAMEVWKRLAGDGDEVKGVRRKLVIGADTVVASNGAILGKPADEEDAFRMLSDLQGRSHSVFTGYTWIADADSDSDETSTVCTNHVETKVYVNAMSEEEIRDYIRTGEPMDKAGAYGIQGLFARFVQGIEGDYLNVVGFPLSAFCQSLKQL